MRKRLFAIGWRAAADFTIALASLAVAFALRLLLALFEPRAVPHDLLPIFLSYFVRQGPLLGGYLVGILALFGVYSKTRFYTRGFKAVTLFQAISLAYALFLCTIYLARQAGGLIPRGVFLLAYMLTLAASMGLRLAKSHFERRLARAATPAAAPAETAGRKILVVGGAGYIGSILVRDLLEEGCRVRVLDSLVYGDEALRGIYAHPNFQLIRGDFRHVAPVVQATRGMDAVIHLGAIVGDPACAVDEDETLQTNLAATRLLADVCRASGVSRILFASTCSVYGAAGHPVDERSQLNPISLYAATKIDSERVLLAARDRNFHPVILRLATAFGWSYRPRFDLVVNLLAARAAVEKKIVIYNGQQWRPFVHVKDISRAFRLALTAPLEAVSGEIFNAGSNRLNLTLQQLAEQIAALEPGLAVEYVENQDARNYCVRFDKIRQTMGFACQATLAQGIGEIQQAINLGLIEDYREPRYSNFQLVSQRHKEHANGNGELKLTALRFAPNSPWLRAMTAGGASSLLALASAVNEGSQRKDAEIRK